MTKKPSKKSLKKNPSNYERDSIYIEWKKDDIYVVSVDEEGVVDSTKIERADAVKLIAWAANRAFQILEDNPTALENLNDSAGK